MIECVEENIDMRTNIYIYISFLQLDIYIYLNINKHL